MNNFTNKFVSNSDNLEFLRKNMMGPNAMRLTEELTFSLKINQRLKILDLGCGCGLSSLFLAEAYDATVFAADLWISPTENFERFKSIGIDDKIIPIHIDATQEIPFAEAYFDMLISVDSYHYFGNTKNMLSKLASFVKKEGYIAIAIPGLKYEFGDNIPDEMKPFWNEDVARTLHSLTWWKDIWNKEKNIEIIKCCEMDSHQEAWNEWLSAYHPVVKNDIKMMKAENGNYFNFIQLIAKVV